MRSDIRGRLIRLETAAANRDQVWAPDVDEDKIGILIAAVFDGGLEPHEPAIAGHARAVGVPVSQYHDVPVAQIAEGHDAAIDRVLSRHGLDPATVTEGERDGLFQRLLAEVPESLRSRFEIVLEDGRYRALPTEIRRAPRMGMPA